MSNRHIFTTSWNRKKLFHAEKSHFVIYKVLKFLKTYLLTRKLNILVFSYWTFPSYFEYEYEPDSDKFDLKSGGVLSLIYTDANFRPISRKI